MCDILLLCQDMQKPSEPLDYQVYSATFSVPSVPSLSVIIQLAPNAINYPVALYKESSNRASLWVLRALESGAGDNYPS